LEGIIVHQPELCPEGVNGTYFLKDTNGDSVAVFKPEDEEANSKNSPKQFQAAGEVKLPNGIITGEAATKEVAAHLLDHEGFYGVPATALVCITHPSFYCAGAGDMSSPKQKIGSFQEYVANDGASWDFGPSKFPTHEVHKIGILDLQILSLDRHGGNILIREEDNGTCSLIPIDNGFCLPDSLSGDIWFEWMNWSQSKESFDTATLSYIERLNPDADAAMLQKELNIRPECLKTMKITTTLLKNGAASGLNLFEIGSMVCTQGGRPSDLQRLCEEAEMAASGNEKTIL